ncbi:MAG: hypothetical protein HC839_00425 [Leptolyngbyaceae cyanobacterium RM2_2_21]|nr:hypothetical protein [Leptolyngbyaceae cyanobacterium RM2_2_21]NJN02581.1 hypothetical protein [Leptolyngbyaceae cyanobacterium RM1_1_2]
MGKKIGKTIDKAVNAIQKKEMPSQTAKKIRLPLSPKRLIFRRLAKAEPTGKQVASKNIQAMKKYSILILQSTGIESVVLFSRDYFKAQLSGLRTPVDTQVR